MNGNNNSLAWNQCIALKPAEYEQNVCIALAQDIPWEREGAISVHKISRQINVYACSSTHTHTHTHTCHDGGGADQWGGGK
jgi:hypothetical protein